MEIVSIIGPIGSGKSTFVEHLKAYNVFNYYYHEDVEGNTWLKAEPTPENQIKCQEYIIEHKKNFYKQFANQNLDNVIVLEDASFYQDLFYVYLNIYQKHDEEFNRLVEEYIDLIKKIYHQANKHKVIFIDLDPNQNVINVQNRGRDFEQSLNYDFFKNQKEVLYEILNRFKGDFELIIYKPDPSMFEDNGISLEEKYHQVYKDLGII